MAENSHCMTKSLCWLQVIKWINYRVVIPILHKAPCSPQNPTRFFTQKVLTDSLSKVLVISKNSEHFRKQEKHKLKHRKPTKDHTRLWINSSPSRAARREEAFASLASEAAGTYFPALLKERDAPLHLKCNHCKTLRTSFLLRNQKAATIDFISPARTDWRRGDTYLWSFLCGEADPSSGAKEPKCIQLY